MRSSGGPEGSQGAETHANRLRLGGERPDGGLAIISTLQMQDGVQYRVLGQPDASWQAVAVEPSLEDGYIWLMKQSREGSPAGA